MRKWELIAIVTALAAVIGTPFAAFGYQAYRKFRLPPGAVPVRAPSISPPKGDAMAGRQIFLTRCAVCHGEDARGKIGPDLHGVASFGKTFLYAFISNPETLNNRATMPRLPLSQQEIADVVAYLMALNEMPEIAEAQVTPMPTPAPSEGAPDVEQGKRLFQSKGCEACHGPGAQGTALAPNLVGKTAEEIRRQVRNPREKMPPFTPDQLSDSELEAIIRYIESLSP